MFVKYRIFVQNISIGWLGKIGVILTTSSFIILIMLVLAQLLGIVTNAYVGLVTFLLFPALFIIGLLLIPLGWFQLKKRTGWTSRQLLEQKFEIEDIKGDLTGSKLFRTIIFFTVINILFMGIVSFEMLGFMDEPHFCGTACHSVMNPEWVTYQESPHARVKCVQCHVGEGAGALIDSKLNGLWQIISVTFNLYERPIPTPVRQLRPARETCEKCHWPEKFYGSRMITRYHYQSDSNSSLLYTTLNLKIDAGKRSEKAGIHWHIGRENEVRYTSVDDERADMIWVEVRQPDGSYKRFVSRDRTAFSTEDLVVRSMDCVDCHNRATHIYEQPGRAIDEKIQGELFDLNLPYLKREALAAILYNYSDSSSALEGIARHLRNFYKLKYPGIVENKTGLIDSAIHVLQNIYRRNIHPHMNISWGAYASHIGHRGNTGCFRCHNSHLVDSTGQTISFDCTLCHSILAIKKEEPFKFLEPVNPNDKDYLMHLYLKDDFLKSYKR